MRVCDGFDLIEAWRCYDGGWLTWLDDQDGGVAMVALECQPSVSCVEGMWRAEINPDDEQPVHIPLQTFWGIVPTGDGHGLLSRWAYVPLGEWLLSMSEPVSVEVDWLRAHKEDG